MSVNLPNLQTTEVTPEFLQILNQQSTNTVVQPDIEDDQKRWLLVGLTLNAVINPALRKYVEPEMNSFYSTLKHQHGIDSQTGGSYLRKYKGSNLIYEAVNNNFANHRHDTSLYNYNICNAVDLSKLFLKPFMAKYSAFDGSCDASALLGMIVNISIFPSQIKQHAKTLRDQIRNPWAHCNFSSWDNIKFQFSFQQMEIFIKSLKLNPTDESHYIADLQSWERNGFSMLEGTRIGLEVLECIKEQTRTLSETILHLAVDTDDQVDQIRDRLKEMEQAFNDSLTERCSALDTRVCKLEATTDVLKSRTDTIESQQEELQGTLDMHTTQIKDLSDSTNTLSNNLIQVDTRLTKVESDVSTVQNEIVELKLYLENAPLDSDDWFFNVPDRIESFTGRHTEIDIMKARFFNSASSTTSCSFAICGLGGIGKTTLAIEYAWLLQENYPGGVFWLSAADGETLNDSIEELAIHADTEGRDFTDTLRKTLKWIASKKEKWLLLVDNVDENLISRNVRTIITGVWKRRSNGHILLTTRREVLELSEALHFEERNSLELGPLDLHDSRVYMTKRIGMKDDENMQSLIEELGGLPLAIEQATAYIKSCNFTYLEYLQQFQARRLEFLAQKKVSRLETPNERLTILTTWTMNFDLIHEESKKTKGGASAPLVMEIIGYCSPDDVPLEMINNGEPHVDIKGNTEIVAKEIISILTKFSLFQRHRENAVRVHRLVQEVIRERITSDEQRIFILKSAICMLNKAFKDTKGPLDILKKGSDMRDDRGILHLWNRLVTNASVLQRHVSEKILQNEEFLNLETARLLHESAVFHSMHGRQEEAFIMQERMLAIILASKLSTDDMRYLTSIKVPLIEEDRKLIQNSIFSNTGKTHFSPEELDDLRQKGNNAFKMQQYRKAIEIYSEGIRSSAKDNIDYRLFANRSQCYRNIGEHLKALEDANKCIEIDDTNWKGHARRAYAIAELCDKGELPQHWTNRGYASASHASHLFPQFNLEYQTKLFFPILLCYFVTSPSELINKLQEIIQYPFTTLLLPAGDYNLTPFVLPRSLQLVGIQTSVNIHIAKDTGIFLQRFSGSEIGSQYNFEPDEEIFIHFENVVFTKTGGQIRIGKGINASFYHCKFHNGKPGCSDYPNCKGGNGCVNKDPFQCRRGNNEVSKDLPTRPLGESPTGIVGYPGIVSENGGKVVIDHCLLQRCGGRGALCDGEGSFMEVNNCEITDMIQMGLEARNGGQLNASMNIIKNNQSHGVAIGPFGNCSLQNNSIFGNDREGILCTINSKAKLKHNTIHHNGLCGISLESGIYEVAYNKIFENWCWGLMIKSRSCNMVLNNDIFENKCGGIRIGHNYSASVFVDGNTIRDHCGPAIHIEPFPTHHIPYYIGRMVGMPEDETRIYTKPPIMSDRNIMRNNDKTYLHPSKYIEANIGCVYCHKFADKLSKCGKCKMASYCSKVCQTEAWPRHKHMCKVLLGSYSEQIDMSKAQSNSNFGIRTFNPQLKGIKEGPKPDRMNSKRFIVKIQSGKEYYTCNPNLELTLYDQSTDVDIRFVNPRIYHIIMECGKLGTNTLSSKKIFCWAAFERQGKDLRVFLDTLAPFQTW